MCLSLSDDLVRHVVSFVPDRKTRSALGYDVDACIRWRIPPPPLPDNPQFKNQLAMLRRVWLSCNGVRTVTADDVQIRSNFMCWSDYDRDHTGFAMHTVSYRDRVNSKLWHVNKSIRYYRYYNGTGAPACFVTLCGTRELDLT